MDQAVRSVDPHAGVHRSGRIQLREQAAHLVRRICGRDLIRALTRDLIGRHVLRAQPFRDHRRQPARRIEKLGHIGKCRRLGAGHLLEWRERQAEVDVTARDDDLEPDRHALLLDGVGRVAVGG